MPEGSEWRVIKTFPLYMINRKGDIMIRETLKVIRPSALNNTYVWLNSKGGGAHRRLVATLRNNAFKE